MLYHRVMITKEKKPAPCLNGMPHIYNSIEIKEVIKRG